VLELYDDQSTVIARLRSAVRAGKRAPLVVSPTGSGKTVMFAWLAQRFAERRRRINILAHRFELTEQISETLSEFGVPHGRIEAGFHYDPRYAVHVASVMTLVRRFGQVQIPDVLIIDEGHHAAEGTSWHTVFEYFRLWNPKLLTTGWTATPERLGGEGLDDTYDCLIEGLSVRQLIDMGRLSDYKLLGPKNQLDVSGLHRRAGDYIKGESEALVDKPVITGDAISHYEKYLRGAPAVAFCVSVRHAEHVASEFASRGFRAASVDGSMTTLERRARFKDFRAATLNVLTSCDLISEGLDVPGMHGAILLRPTESLALYLQQVGRSLRKFPGKEFAFILDHVGNWKRHGLPCVERQWKLTGTGAERRKKDPNDIAIRQCAQCGAVGPATLKECPECGFVFITLGGRKIDEVEGELEEIDPRVAAMQFRRDRRGARDLDSLIELGRMRGMKNPEGWARHVLDARDAKRARARTIPQRKLGI